MSGAYVELLPPDRPVHMVGQPIIRLYTDGGPGEDLGDIGHSAYLSPADLRMGCHTRHREATTRQTAANQLHTLRRRLRYLIAGRRLP